MNRRKKLKVDPVSNTVYTEEACVQLESPKKSIEVAQENEEEGEGEDDNEQEEEEGSDFDDDESVMNMEVRF